MPLGQDLGTEGDGDNKPGSFKKEWSDKVVSLSSTCPLQDAHRVPTCCALNLHKTLATACPPKNKQRTYSRAETAKHALNLQPRTG